MQGLSKFQPFARLATTILYRQLFSAALQSKLPTFEIWSVLSLLSAFLWSWIAVFIARHPEELHPAILARWEMICFAYCSYPMYFYDIVTSCRLLPMAQKLVQANCEDRFLKTHASCLDCLPTWSTVRFAKAWTSHGEKIVWLQQLYSASFSSKCFDSPVRANQTI